MSTRANLLTESGQVMQDFMATSVFFQEAVARAAHLNGTDLQAVGILIREGPTTPGELARRMGVTAGGAITLLVDRLESAGYAFRTRDQHDRRRVLVTASADTVAANIGPLYAPVAQQWTQYLQTLTTEQLHTCLDLLRTAVTINHDQLQLLSENAASTPAPTDGGARRG